MAITLFNYQTQIIEKSKDRNEYALFLETGTGKTIITLETVKYLYQNKKIGAAIITAPKTVLKPVWLKMLGDFYSDLDFYIFQWIGGMSEHQEQIYKQLVKQVENTHQNILLFFLINAEAFSHNKVYRFAESIMKHFKAMWVIDESTLIKSPLTKRTKAITSISHLAEYKRILSGFPVLKTPEDLYSQVQFLGLHLIPYKSFYAFRNQFTFTKKLDNRVTISTGARNTEELKQLLEPFSTRLLKKDCLDLPEKIHTCRYVDMTREQKDYYEKMKKQGFFELKNTEKKVFAHTLLSQLEKLHQIANGIDVSNETYFDCDKYKILIDIIKNEIGDSQLIIWSFYIMNIYYLQLCLLKENIKCGVIYGEVSLHERSNVIEEFVQGKLQVVIANPATAMHGINWQNSSYAIYLNNSFHLEHRLQSEDRQHRIGQVNKVTYIDLVTDNTIEDRILDVLQKKHSVGAESLGDEWEEWFN